MWKIYSDSYLLHDPRLEEYILIDAELNLELNKTGNFSFTIYPDHPNYDRLDKLKSIITVYQDDELYFRGRILNDTLGLYNERQVFCEGELAFFIDSIQRPFKFPEQAGAQATPAAYFNFLVTRHNEQVGTEHQFVVGRCTVTDPNNYIARSDTEYSTTWQLLNEGLLDTLGGYLWVDSDSDGHRRINYYADFDVLGNQPIEFGKNLLNIMTERRGENVATAILPIGKEIEETGERLTISSLPDETSADICKRGDIVYSIAAEQTYGDRITKVVTWNDVTDATNLLNKAKAYLGTAVMQTQTTDFSAADLAAAGHDFSSFKLGTYVRAASAPHSATHGVSGVYLVKKLSIKIANPAGNTLTVGAASFTFTEQNKKTIATQMKKVATNITNQQAQAMRELERRTYSEISQSNEKIRSEVTAGYYAKSTDPDFPDDVQALETRTTAIEQTADNITMNFHSFKAETFEPAQQETAMKFTEINKYIRFVNGNIILGEEGSDQTQVITNTQNQFKQGNAVVAYIGDHKLYITDGEFSNSLKLGKFAFLPRENGNLSFKKVIN